MRTKRAFWFAGLAGRFAGVLGLGWCALAGGTLRAEPVLHVFGVYCNAYKGDAGAINDSVSADRRLIHDLFTQQLPGQGWGVTVRSGEVQGEAATKQGILQAFAAFAQNVAAEDTIYVHFSGHGAILDEAAGVQFLQACDEELINRDEWARQINELPCRLKIFVTDCCSTYPESVVAEGDADVEPWDNLYFLLLRHEGFVNITAASPGQAAYGNDNGGYLTVNLHSDMQRFRSWREVFESTQARVLHETEEEARAAGDAITEVQKPFAHSLGRALFTAAEKLPADAGFVIADSHRRTLSRAELETMGLQQLYLARNEIFARHGFDFSTPFLQRYFASRSWYQVQPGFKSPVLNAAEKHNSELILQVEKDQGGPFMTAPKPAAEVAGADIFPYSSDQLLSRAAVQDLSPRDLSIARNEILARHGYPFRSPALQAYFSGKPDYVRDPGAADPSLNGVEEQNVWLLQKIERIKGGAYQW